MRIVTIVLLLGFWLFLANRALQRGDMQKAGLYAAIGVALTAYRLMQLKSRQSSLPPSDPPPAA